MSSQKGLTVCAATLPVFNDLVRRWSDCRACSYNVRRSSVVVARGQIPAPFCFIGEAPGEVEDNLGEPFLGPSGDLLNFWINETRSQLHRAIKQRFTYAVINTVGCIPLRYSLQEASWEMEKPCDQSIDACYPRLIELIQVIQPLGIVLLGKTAESAIDPTTRKAREARPHRFNNVLKLPHPAYVLRQGGKRSPLTNEVILRLFTFVHPLICQPSWRNTRYGR